MILGTKKKSLIDVLVETGKLRPEMVHNWRNLSNSEVEKRLTSEHMVSSEDIARAYCQIYSLPYISLKERQIPPDSLTIIPENLAQEYKIIAYEYNREQKKVKIAVANPANLSENLQQVLEELKKKKDLNIELAITAPEDFNAALLESKNLSPPPSKSSQTIPIKVTPPAPVASLPTSAQKTIDLEKITIALEVISKFPEDIARKYKMVVFEAPHPSFIKVALVEPEDKKVREILDFVRQKNDIAIEEYQTTPGQIHRAMRFYHPQEIKKELPSIPTPSAQEAPKRFVPKPATPIQPPPSPKPSQEAPPEQKVPEVQGKTEPHEVPQENDFDKFLEGEPPVKEPEDLQAIAETGHVPKIVAATVSLGVAQKASDIHIEPGEKDLRIRLRVDGILRDIVKLPLELQPSIISRIKILAKLKIDESRIPQDGRFDALAQGHQVDLRVSTLPTVHGEKAALRILDKSLKMYTLEELGLTGRSLKILTENIDKPYGVILATGPTGSGKSTTLYAILNRISTPSVNIITLEDPVEYELPGLNQCQIKPKIGFTFANGLRSVLRQDPNIIMVGEIRDAETASLATHAALTGHLVLTTLHTNDAAGALPRLINMGIEPFLITSSINAILSQRLVRKLCPQCKKPAHIPEPVIKEIEAELNHFNLPKPYHFFEGRGCQNCEQGYRGRIGIFEVLPMTEKIENLAITKRPASEIKLEANKEGMVTMKQDGLIKALKGITTVNEVLRVVSI